MYFQTIENSNPVVYFYKLIETKTETALGGFETMRNAWLSEKKKEFYNYMRNNLIGFASDGAPTNVGDHGGIIKYLRDFATNKIYAVHCMAHRLELAVSHAFDSMNKFDNMDKINNHLDQTITKTYSFYRKGFKRRYHLKKTCEDLNIKFYVLHEIISIRWVASDLSAMKAIHKMWKALVMDLERIEKERNEFEVSARNSAKVRRNNLSGRNFLVMF